MSGAGTSSAGTSGTGTSGTGVRGAAVGGAGTSGAGTSGVGLPLVVGVTGHRNVRPQDEAALKSAFAGILAELRASYPATAPLVLTGLAAGADSLAAEEALALGIAVIAALPMPVEEYEHDFDAAGLLRFRALLARCSEVRVVHAAADRPGGYIAVGAFIAYHSHVVVAFWDGQKGEGGGGTADVVRMRSSGLGPGADGPDVYVPDIGPIYQIVTPRDDKPPPVDAFRVNVHHPRRFRGDKFTQRDFAGALACLNRYNRDVAELGGLTKTSSGLAPLMKSTDRAANLLQAWTLFFVRLLYVLAFFAGVAQVAFGNEVAKIVTLALGVGAFFLAKWFNYEDRYQDYRALEEGLRVQRAWCDAGLGARRVEAFYLKMQQSELQWIRLALRTAYLVFCGHCAEEGASVDLSDALSWIREQWRYYHKAARREANSQRICNLVTYATFCVGGLLAAISGALSYPKFSQLLPPEWAFWAETHGPFLQHWTTAPLAVAALVAALLSGYAAKRGFASNGKRYQRMFLVFDHARRRLNAAKRGLGGDPGDVIAEVGREALSEHADWLLLRREYPLSLVLD